MTVELFHDPLPEIPDQWRSHPEFITVPNGYPEHIVNNLLDVIEMWADGIPSAQQCQAMQRLARALREEIR